MRAVAVVFVLTLAGCGYHLAGEQIALPEDVRSLSVGTVNNRSREYGLEKTLAFAFEREILERGHFHVSQEPGGADAVLSGTIRDLRVHPVSFNANDQAVQYEIALVVDLVLTRQQDGHVLWRANGLSEVDEYSTSGGVVVTSSSQFQQGTLNASDLRNPEFATMDPQTISIQLSETERRRAIERLLSQAVRDIYNQMVESF